MQYGGRSETKKNQVRYKVGEKKRVVHLEGKRREKKSPGGTLPLIKRTRRSEREHWITYKPAPEGPSEWVSVSKKQKITSEWKSKKGDVTSTWASGKK